MPPNNQSQENDKTTTVNLRGIKTISVTVDGHENSESIDLNANETQTRYFICQKHCNNGAKFKITCNIPEVQQVNNVLPLVSTNTPSPVEEAAADSYILTSYNRRILNTVDVYNGISIDECRYKCFVDETCQHFNYEEGTCTIGYGLYEQTSHLGNNLISSDKYKLSYLDSGVLERVNRYFKRFCCFECLIV